MIQTKIQFNLANAKRYFREHLGAGDYYSQGRQVAGEWLGLGAEKLGLSGEVGESAFIALCEGKHPESGQRLGQRLNDVRREAGKLIANRRVFFDFTIAPPKSVSVVALFQDERIVELHNRAVRVALLELEMRAETRVRKSGKNGERVTGNLVAACFRHDTSRELDPHLHTHCVVMNATHDPVEARWKALHPAGMYRAHRFASNLYRHELAKGLRGLGYELETHAHGFEIKGVPVSVINRFSKRHRQIDEETNARIAAGESTGNVKALREQIAHGNRRRKLKNATADKLRMTWANQMPPQELIALAALRKMQPQPVPKGDASALVAWADEHLFERRSVLFEDDLLAEALAHGQGQSVALEELRAAVARRDYIREKDGERLTSRTALAWEREVVAAAQHGRRKHEGINPAFSISSGLLEEQRQAVAELLGSRDLVTIFSGGAGTGKSFTLKEVSRGIISASREVVVLAPQRQQVQDLQADGLPAQTLSLFLMGQKIQRGAVVILDEAGQVGAKQMALLIRAVRENQGRLILSGDTRQHGAVAASDALLAIEKHTGLRPIEIHTIRRQDPDKARTSAERTFIQGYREAVKLAAKGNTVGSFSALDRLGCIREVGEEAGRRAAVADEYLAALERDERTLVVAQTREEARQMNEVIRARLRDAGKIGAGVVVRSCRPVDLDDAQKRDARFYQAGQYACFLRGYGRFAKGDLCPIVEANERGVVIEKNGRRSTFGYRYTDRIVVAVGAETEVAPGDRLQLKFNGKSREGARLNNGELVTVCEVRPDGALVVEDAKRNHKTLGPDQRLFVRGYAVTSYGSQGKTVDTVLFADAGTKAATDARQWYVTISRGRRRVVVFTSDKEALRAHVQASGERPLAIEVRPAGAPGRMSAEWRRRVAAEQVRQASRRFHAHAAANHAAAVRQGRSVGVRV
jgi:conjugative relaxase-like TrwC/TraI family protein